MTSTAWPWAEHTLGIERQIGQYFKNPEGYGLGL
jgi:hypothetical protein